MSKHRGKPTAAEVVRRLKRNGECLEWGGGKDLKGYGSVHIGRNRYKKAHRYVYELLIGTLAPANSLLHSCDNKLCCNVEHLREGTNAENMRDKADRAAIKGRKLDRAGLHRLRALRASGLSYRELAAQLGVSAQTAHNACAGRTYYGTQYE